MRILCLTLAATAYGIAFLPAQNVTAPAIFASSEGGTSGNIWRAGINRVQNFYDTSNFISQGVDFPIIINNLSWREAGGLLGAAVTYPAVDIFICSSTTDFLTPSLTFATNRGADNTLVYSGPVSVTTASGTTPNDFVINLPLTTTFTYNPTLGADLLVEIVINANPAPLTGTTMSCGFSQAAHLCNSVRSVGSTTATTGSISAFATVCKFGYTEPPNVAHKTNYGTGCYNAYRSFYENFNANTFDLNNTTVTLTPNGSGGYVVTSAPGAVITPPVSVGLGMGDDTISSVALPFSFPFPGGSTSTIDACSDGYLWLGLNANADFSPTAAELLAQTSRIAAAWTDLNGSAGGGGGDGFYDIDPSNTFVLFTFQNIQEFGQPTSVSNFQIALFATGVVELRYQTVSNVSNPLLVGFSSGGGANDPGNRDLSATMPFVTQTDLLALACNASARPVQGATISLVTSNIPATAIASANFLSFTQFPLGINLTSSGMPGCFQYVGLDAQILAFTNPSFSRSLTIPTGAIWLGAVVVSQSASLVPGVNPLGALSSNGTRLLFGSL